jgi:uncharacterized protein YuzE
MMQMHYDPEADAFAVHFAPKGAYVESEEVAPGVILDFDADGQVIGIEVLDVRKRMTARPAADAPVSPDKPAAAE